jgi:hypothetical protein
VNHFGDGNTGLFWRIIPMIWILIQVSPLVPLPVIGKAYTKAIALTERTHFYGADKSAAKKTFC